MSIAGTILSQAHKNDETVKIVGPYHGFYGARNEVARSQYILHTLSWAMPSQGAGTVNSAGAPPAAQTPSLTYWASSFKGLCPGLTSFQELTMPMMGFLKVLVAIARGVHETDI